MYTQLHETFAINNRINLYLLDAIKEDHLSDICPGSKGRSVGRQWAHLHDVRMMWLQAAAPALLEGLAKLTEEEALQKKSLSHALIQSGKAVEALFDQAAASGRIKGFKPGPVAFLGYLLAHDAHHRGQVMLILKQNKHLVDRRVQYGIWEWGSR